MGNPESERRRTSESYDAEKIKIARCAEIITQILTDNRETINLIFKDIKEKLEIENKKKELAKDRPPEGGVKKFW